MKVHLISWVLESLAALPLAAGLHLHVTVQLGSGCYLQGGFSAKPKGNKEKQ